MGILSRLFKSEQPGRERWAAISLQIAQSFEEIRNKWFQTCVQGLQAAEKDEQGENRIIVKRDRLGGNADRSLKAYQLLLASESLAAHAYIQPTQGRDFADILYAQVCGTEIEECLTFFDRYHKAQDGGQRVFRFSSDLTKYITDTEAPLIESMMIVPTLPFFSVLTQMIVSDAFGDQRTVEQLQKKLSSIKGA